MIVRSFSVLGRHKLADGAAGCSTSFEYIGRGGLVSRLRVGEFSGLRLRLGTAARRAGFLTRRRTGRHLVCPPGRLSRRARQGAWGPPAEHWSSTGCHQGHSIGGWSSGLSAGHRYLWSDFGHLVDFSCGFVAGTVFRHPGGCLLADAERDVGARTSWWLAPRHIASRHPAPDCVVLFDSPAPARSSPGSAECITEAGPCLTKTPAGSGPGGGRGGD